MNTNITRKAADFDAAINYLCHAGYIPVTNFDANPDITTIFPTGSFDPNNGTWQSGVRACGEMRWTGSEWFIKFF